MRDGAPSSDPQETTPKFVGNPLVTGGAASKPLPSISRHTPSTPVPASYGLSSIQEEGSRPNGSARRPTTQRAAQSDLREFGTPSSDAGGVFGAGSAFGAFGAFSDDDDDDDEAAVAAMMAEAKAERQQPAASNPLAAVNPLAGRALPDVAQRVEAANEKRDARATSPAVGGRGDVGDGEADRDDGNDGYDSAGDDGDDGGKDTAAQEEDEEEPLPPLTAREDRALGNALKEGYYKFKSVLLHERSDWKNAVICMKPPFLKVCCRPGVVHFVASAAQTTTCLLTD